MCNEAQITFTFSFSVFVFFGEGSSAMFLRRSRAPREGKRRDSGHNFPKNHLRLFNLFKQGVHGYVLDGGNADGWEGSAQ